MKRIYIFLMLLVLVPVNINSKSKSIVGFFPTIDHSGSISKKFDYGFYYFAALPLINFKDPEFSRDEYYLLFYSEQALTYNVNMHLSFTGSYVFQKENPFSPNYTNENRVYLQSTYRHTVKLLKLKYRVRFYNRFVHNRTSGKTLYTHRLRYLIGMEIPIKSKKNNLYFTAYEEVFLIPLKMPELFMEKTGLCRHRD